MQQKIKWKIYSDIVEYIIRSREFNDYRCVEVFEIFLF